MRIFPLPRALLAGLLTAAAVTPAALAQAMVDPADVTHPAAFVPPVLYRSVFVDTPRGVEAETLDWIRANTEVGQFRRGQVDILKWEAEQAARGARAPSEPATGSQAAPAAGPHHGAKP